VRYFCMATGLKPKTSSGGFIGDLILNGGQFFIIADRFNTRPDIVVKGNLAYGVAISSKFLA